MYVLLLDMLEKRFERQVFAATMAAAVGAEVEMPDELEVRAEFEAWLREPPKADVEADPDRLALMRGLGLRD